MTEPTALFFDIGGIVLSNGWDRKSRARAVQEFGLDGDDFDSRHEMVVHAFEMGQITLDDYLRRTVFYKPRSFTREEFESFLFNQSQENSDGLAAVKRYAAAGRWLVAAVNNESLELNEFRIKKFKLREAFSIFLSSCYLGVRKPDEKLYRLALGITQRAPAESVFIDNRDINIEGAARLGVHVVLYRNPEQLIEELGRLGVRLE